MNESDHFVLKYVGGDEVRIGDRVAKKKLFSLLGKERYGRVIYVPGQCAPHPEMERDGMSYWAVRFDDGDLAAWLHHPAVKAITKFRLIQRGDSTSGPASGERLFEDETFE